MINRIKKLWNDLINGREEAQETEFMPAILEVTETPPSPVGRLVMWSILALLAAGLIWAFVGTINEVAVATGKVIPTGQVKTIQVKNKGIIKEINVKEGQHVEEGEVLVVLDPTTTDADNASLKKRAAYYKLDIDRLEAELKGAPFQPAPDAELETSDLLAEKNLYQSRTTQYRSEVASAQNAVSQKQAALAAEEKNYEKYAGMLAIAVDKEHRLQQLVKENAIAEFQLLEQTSQRINLEETTNAQRDMVAKARAELAEAQSRLSTVDSGYRKDIMTSLVESRKQYLAYQEEIKKADENQRLATVTAPCSGRVYNLAVHTEGGIVTDAQPLMMIVPDGTGLEFEVWADNKDIGFIKEGQEAEVKVSTFNFQKFGMVKAVVDEIGADAYSDKTDVERNKKYRLTLNILQDDINIFGQKADLTPGMEVTAEIKIKEKRIIDFFLDPFRRYTSEALRER